MSLRVWLPLTSNIIENNGLENLDFSSSTTMQLEDNGKIGKCLYRNGAGIVRSNLFNVNSTTQASICIWLKMPADYTTNGYIGGLTAGASPNFMFNNYGVETIRIYINGSYRLSYTHGFAAEEWHHIAATYNGNLLTLYLDGKQVKTATGSWNINEQERIMIGGRSNNADGGATNGRNNYYNDFRYYDHCLSAAEVHDIAQGLVLHYKLDGTDTPNENLGNTSADYHNKTNGLNVTANKFGGDAGEVTYYHSGGYAGLPYKVYHKTATGSGGIYVKTDNDIILEANTTYTMSCWIKASRNFTASPYSFNINRGTDNHYITYGTNFPITTEWQFLSKTFTTTGSEAGAYGEMSIIYDDGETDYYVYYSGFKIEKGDTATRWTPPGIVYNEITDSSGYKHNGWIIDTEITSTTPRYENAIVCNGATVDSTSNTVVGAEYFFGNLPMPASSAITVAWWGKNDNYSRGGIFETTASTFTATTGMVPSDYNTTAIANWDTTFRIYNGSSYVNIYSSFVKDGNWHHHAIVFDGTNVYYYCDGIVKTSGALTGTLPAFNGIRVGLGRAGGVYRQIKQSISDLRIYCTPLLDTDIKSLYNIGMRIDNLQNIHVFELNENGTNRLTKTGILYDNIVEPYLTLPDGSNWKLLLYHYVDNGDNLFTQSNATYCNDFGLYSRLKDIANYTYDGKYEYYVIQDGKEFRWTQTSSPTAASIAGLTTVSGYNNPVNGLAKPSSLTQTYIGYNAWWGACGCWTKYSTGGKTGIPGFGSHDVNGMCTKYLALYARIDKPHASLIDLSSEANEFIER